MIPSLLQIPSAVSDSKLHSVLPNNGKGDFSFDRSTGATRINKDGLIEEVGYFSSELVQNGNFSELGSELVTNGDFATDSNWDKLNATINNGKATVNVVDGAFSFVNQDKSLTSGKTFKLTAEVKGLSNSSGKQIKFQDKSNNTGGLNSANGTITLNESVQNIEIYWVANSNSAQIIVSRVSSGTYSFEIDNVSVKQVDPNDRWTLGTGWSYGNGILSCVGDSGHTAATQSISFENGKTYKVITDITITSGNFKIQLTGGGSTSGNTMSSTGIYTDLITANADRTTLSIRSNDGNGVGSVSSISVVEVQGDRPRLSYDITNGVVEDKPHLLLEPSSTNSITFSNDLSQSVWSGSNINNSVYGQVGVNGTNNAWLFTKTGASNSDFYNTAFTGTYTFSFFVKKEANKGVKIYNFGDTVQQSTINIETGAYVAGVNTVTIQEFPNDWLRVAQTLTISNGKYYLYISDGTTTQIASSIVVQYFQIEQQAFPTTYIPTAGTTITRAAETCNNSKPSVNSTEGVLYAEIAALANDSTDRRITISDGTTNNRMCIGFDNASNKIKYFLIASNSSQVNEDVSVSDITQFNKIAFKFKANDFELYMNGNVIASDTSGSTFSANTLDVIKFAGYTGTTQEFYGKVKGLAVYNEALSESQLMQLTGVTASSIYSNFVTRTASFTVEALNEVKKVIDNL